MKEFAHLAEADQRPYQEASAWQLRLAADPSLEVSPEFQSWLSAPENQVAFEGVNLAWQSAADFAVEPVLLDMRQAALRRVREAGTQRWQPRKTVWRLAAALTVALVGGIASYYHATLPDKYATAIGERILFSLPDHVNRLFL